MVERDKHLSSSPSAEQILTDNTKRTKVEARKEKGTALQRCGVQKKE